MVAPSAPRSTGQARVEVHVEGELGAIPARAFLNVLRVTLDVLDQVDRAGRASAPPRGHWLIAELLNQSAAAVLWREDDPESPTPLRLVDGVRQLHHAPGLPPYFSPQTARALATIGIEARRKGVSGIVYKVPAPEGGERLESDVSEAVVVNATASVQRSDHAVGSVSGLLDVINLRRGAHRVSLYDDKARRAISCRFPDDMFNQVRDALGRRVRALGTVARNQQGQILSVQIGQLDLLPEPQNVPSVDELVGIAPWYTGDRSTEDYLRWMRHD